jgi:CheY-like chemotaxis protein
MNPLRGRRLLVVDDDEAVRVALCARLEAWGAEVISLDGLPAVEQWLAEGHPAPHVLLTDHRLPVGNGLLVIAALRERHGEALPALMITGNTAPEDIAAFSRSGIPVLHKPFQKEALLAEIERAASGAR